ncbi:IS66 family insertion sequence element accessory protein TnpB [Streptococcus suis]|uniref:IS66 family insertion sequence element accessory protein TnpB n=1 Tax=Streptococcus suis TaxID=1307 RepID=UPI0028E56CAC|nr:IS66 family insertion sequence element accessory protein TnpB [Streptococcus suis]
MFQKTSQNNWSVICYYCSLAYLVKSQFNLNPFSGQVYLFCGGRKDRFKALSGMDKDFGCFINALEKKIDPVTQ